MTKKSDVWWSLVIGILCFLMGVTLLGFGLVSDSLSQVQVIGVVILILVGILLPVGIYRLYVFQRRLEQRRQALRQAALAGDTSIAPLAELQPVPDEAALPLPVTIKTRPNWLSIIPACGLLALFLWVVLGSVLLNLDVPDRSTPLHIFTIVAICSFGLYILIVADAARQQLEITYNALMLRGSSIARIPWE